MCYDRRGRQRSRASIGVKLFFFLPLWLSEFIWIVSHYFDALVDLHFGNISSVLRIARLSGPIGLPVVELLRFTSFVLTFLPALCAWHSVLLLEYGFFLHHYRYKC
jgi:hypothetical protein